MANQFLKKNYLLGLDLMTLLWNDNLPKVGKTYPGVLILTDDHGATFIEKYGHAPVRRNERIYVGEHITMTYRPKDDHIRLNFKEAAITPGFDIDNYAIEVMQEIRKALKGFVEEAQVA